MGHSWNLMFGQLELFKKQQQKLTDVRGSFPSAKQGWWNSL